MRKFAPKIWTMIALALAAALVLPQRAAADDDDPPSRVARLSYTHGAVSFQPAGTEDWVSAVVNRPLTTGDKLWADTDARAELNIGSASIRLSSTTGFSFLNLADDTVQMRLTEGTLRIRVKRLGDNEAFEVDTPNLAFSVLRPGTYKINVNEAGDTTIVTVLGGEGEVTGGGQAFSIHAGEAGTFTGTDQLNGDVESYGGDEDDFDRWCADRDHREDRSQSARYVSPDAVGAEDLDGYGGWRPVPEYGTVWFPHTTVVGWAPYRYGHWVWISPWGWTWVDDEPWGFAPFHYGRWVVVGGVWGWVPCAPAPVVVGVAYVRPVYAPALVAWVGGAHWGVGVGVGAGVAWFPLGPREVYMPSYPVSRTYVNNVNVTNTTVNNTVVNNYYNNVVVNKNVTVNNTNVTNIKYVNQSVPGAVTATSHEAFTSAQPVAKNMVKVDAREVANAPVNATTPTVVPQQKSVLGAGAAAVKPPASFQNRAVVAKNTPPPPPPSFAKQQEAIHANGGKPLAVSQLHQLGPERAGPATATVKIAPPAKPAASQPGEANHPGQPKANVANANRPPSSNAPNQPVQSNRPGATVTPIRQKTLEDRPPSARPSAGASAVNPQLEQKHQHELDSLRQKQDQERQKVEQQQSQDRQKLARKNADDQAQAQLNQKHQQQLEQLEQRHGQQQQKLQQKQQQEHQKEKPPSKPPKEDRPAHR